MTTTNCQFLVVIYLCVDADIIFPFFPKLFVKSQDNFAMVHFNNNQTDTVFEYNSKA